MKIKQFVQSKIFEHIKFGIRPYTQENWSLYLSVK